MLSEAAVARALPMTTLPQRMRAGLIGGNINRSVTDWSTRQLHWQTT